MHVKYGNVNDAFRGLVGLLDRADRGEVSEPPVSRVGSRNGPVLRVGEPVVVTYARPAERVLFNRARDASPFLHLYGALHMLAGRGDVAPLAYYAPRMRDYSDDGMTLNGAYGRRWRHAGVFRSGEKYLPDGLDQLETLVRHLREHPDSRRAVLQMWNVADDLRRIDMSRDVCCNLCVKFSLRVAITQTNGPHVAVDPVGRRNYFLDVTVFNRSNDLVWGTLGEDYVNFSVLQEYVAARLGAGVGVMNQVADDLHVYVENNSGFRPQEWLADETPNYYGFADNGPEETPLTLTTVPLVRDPTVFDRELPDFVGAFNGEEEPWDCVERYEEPFLQTVAGPLLTAFRHHKQRDYFGASGWVERVAADDWRIAGRNWIKKRQKNWEAKSSD